MTHPHPTNLAILHATHTSCKFIEIGIPLTGYDIDLRGYPIFRRVLNTAAMEYQRTNYIFVHPLFQTLTLNHRPGIGQLDCYHILET
jgi:hypothetical protein